MRNSFFRIAIEDRRFTRFCLELGLGVWSKLASGTIRFGNVRLHVPARRG